MGRWLGSSLKPARFVCLPLDLPAGPGCEGGGIQGPIARSRLADGQMYPDPCRS